MSHPLIGSYLGKYKIISVAETNNSSISFRAFDTETNIKKLVIVFKESYASTEKQKQTLYTTLIETTKWSHQNIVSPEEVSYEKNTFYAGFPLYDQSLADMCQKSGVITTKEALNIALQIGRALSYAHEKGVIHANISPFSVFITPNKEIKIIGFGFIPEVDFWINSDIIDCPFYSAPELVIENKISPASDLYSLGTTLFHLLSGLMPFEGETTEAIFQQIAFSPTPVIQKYRPNISTVINKLIKKLMEKKPQERFTSTNQFLQELNISAESNKTSNKRVEEVFLNRIQRSQVPLEQIINILETISNQKDVKSQAKSLMERIAIQELSEKLNCSPNVIEAVKNNPAIMSNPKQWVEENISRTPSSTDQTSTNALSQTQKTRIIKSGNASEYLTMFAGNAPQKKESPTNNTAPKSTKNMDFETFKQSRQVPGQTPIRTVQSKKVFTPIATNMAKKPANKPSTETFKVPATRETKAPTIFAKTTKLLSLALLGITIVAGVYILLSPYLQQELKKWFFG